MISGNSATYASYLRSDQLRDQNIENTLLEQINVAIQILQEMKRADLSNLYCLQNKIKLISSHIDIIYEQQLLVHTASECSNLAKLSDSLSRIRDMNLIGSPTIASPRYPREHEKVAFFVDQLLHLVQHYSSDQIYQFTVKNTILLRTKELFDLLRKDFQKYEE